MRPAVICSMHGEFRSGSSRKRPRPLKSGSGGIGRFDQDGLHSDQSSAIFRSSTANLRYRSRSSGSVIRHPTKSGHSSKQTGHPQRKSFRQRSPTTLYRDRTSYSRRRKATSDWSLQPSFQEGPIAFRIVWFSTRTPLKVVGTPWFRPRISALSSIHRKALLPQRTTAPSVPIFPSGFSTETMTGLHVCRMSSKQTASGPRRKPCCFRKIHCRSLHLRWPKDSVR
ncbi:MAG: hypothetical protein BWY82_01990 [Verrucomicrobia bacterium ADurb.Bin474]|nr:MAG: hypothetical protein BWY82_01990 [Verrucomicrobia bacterium ADurb.Bin474]